MTQRRNVVFRADSCDVPGPSLAEDLTALMVHRCGIELNYTVISVKVDAVSGCVRAELTILCPVPQSAWIVFVDALIDLINAHCDNFQIITCK